MKLFLKELVWYRVCLFISDERLLFYVSVCIENVRLLDRTKLHVYNQDNQNTTESLYSSAEEAGDVSGGMYVIALLVCFQSPSASM